jgi:hypothetical protein
MPKLIILDLKAMISFTSTNQGFGPKINTPQSIKWADQERAQSLITSNKNKNKIPKKIERTKKKKKKKKLYRGKKMEKVIQGERDKIQKTTKTESSTRRK